MLSLKPRDLIIISILGILISVPIFVLLTSKTSDSGSEISSKIIPSHMKVIESTFHLLQDKGYTSFTVNSYSLRDGYMRIEIKGEK